jgi:hypothetical protein
VFNIFLDYRQNTLSPRTFRCFARKRVYTRIIHATIRAMTQMHEIELKKADYAILKAQISNGDLALKARNLLLQLLEAAEDPKQDPQNHLLKQEIERVPPAKTQRREKEKPTEPDYWNAKDEVGGVKVRTDIANLRKDLSQRLWSLSKGRECVLTIPPRGQRIYRIVAMRPSGLERFWLPHVNNHGPLTVLLYERLFFRYGNDVYIRSTNVNDDDELDRLVEDLPCVAEVKRQLRASMHYISSGELYGGIAVQEFLREHFNALARIRIHQEARGHTNVSDAGNRIILAASRVGDPDIDRNDHERFTATEKGVEPGFPDHTAKPEHRTIHVLFSRRSQDGSVSTVLQGTHGRAIQGVCEYLGRPDTTEAIMDNVGLKDNRLPAHFQMVFQVLLTYDGRAKVSRPTRVAICSLVSGQRVFYGPSSKA